MNGKYNSKNTLPDKGLAVARMAAHITYLSKKGLQEKFGRKLQERDRGFLQTQQPGRRKQQIDSFKNITNVSKLVLGSYSKHYQRAN